MTMARGAGIGVMIVVPAFAACQQPQDHIVAADVRRIVIAVVPDMGQSIYRPCKMPIDNGPQGGAPDKKAQTELSGILRTCSRQRRSAKTSAKICDPGQCRDEKP